MKTTFETDDCKVTFNSGPETKEAVFNKIIEWFKEYQSFSGECICQSDDPQIYAPQLLGEIADEILKFEVEYKE